MFGCKTCVDRPRPVTPKSNKFHLPLSLPHIPEIGGSPFELRFRPGRPDTVMMHMIGRVIVRDLFATGTKYRMNISTSLELGFDPGAGKFGFRTVIHQH